MAYIGNTPAEAYTSIDKQTITGDGGASYTLDHAVANENEIEVFVNNVRQEPSVAYTVSGTALTMTGNVESSDDFYVVFQGKAIQTTSHPEGHDLKARDGTFSGDLTVDTNTLYVDSTNDHVGIGTTSIASLGSQHKTLQINGRNTSNAGALRLRSTDNSVDSALWASSAATYLATISNDPLHLRTNNTDRIIINADGSWGKAPAGTVLQTKSTLVTATGSFSVASGTAVQIPGATVTITPKSSSSKILIFARLHGENSAGNGADMGVNVYRATSGNNGNVNSGASAGSRARVMQNLGVSYNKADNYESTPEHNTVFALDSPSTTNSITYSIRIYNTHPSNSRTFYYNRTGSHVNQINYEVGSTEIVVQEIAG